MYVYIYIYIERERDSDDLQDSPPDAVSRVRFPTNRVNLKKKKRKSVANEANERIV